MTKIYRGTAIILSANTIGPNPLNSSVTYKTKEGHFFHYLQKSISHYRYFKFVSVQNFNIHAFVKRVLKVLNEFSRQKHQCIGAGYILKWWPHQIYE